MDVHLSPTHIYALNPSLDFETARQQAIDKRLGIVAGGLGALLSRPKPEEVELVYAEIRFEPLWHVVCATRFAYERNREFSVPVGGAEVRKVTLLGQAFEVGGTAQAPQPGLLQQLGIGAGGAARAFSVPGVEHCLEESRQERFFDAVTGQPAPLGGEFAQKDKTELSDASALALEEALVVPPQTSAVKIVKSLLATMIKPIQADKILEEAVRIETLDLYFRPLYGFEFAWKPKNKTGVAEFDAVTGAMAGGKVLHTRSDRSITREGLFDISADTVVSLLPSASSHVNLIVE